MKYIRPSSLYKNMIAHKLQILIFKMEATTLLDKTVIMDRVMDNQFELYNTRWLQNLETLFSSCLQATWLCLLCYGTLVCGSFLKQCGQEN